MNWRNGLQDSNQFNQKSLSTFVTSSSTKVLDIGRYEREATKPIIQMAGRLTDVLGVPLDCFVSKVDTALDADTLSRVRGISALSDDDRSFVLRAMDGLIRVL